MIMRKICVFGLCSRVASWSWYDRQLDTLDTVLHHISCFWCVCAVESTKLYMSTSDIELNISIRARVGLVMLFALYS